MKKWLASKGIEHKVALPSRHRQVAIAEYINYVVGKSVAIKQNTKEYQTGKTNREWVKLLPAIIRGYNRHVRSKLKKQGYNDKAEPLNDKVKPRQEKLSTVKCKGQSCEILDKNTRVRVLLDRPINQVTGKKESGPEKFRAGDIRWDPTARRITRIVLKAGQPVMYRVEGIGQALYTRQQLFVIGKDEKAPKTDPNKKWLVDKILKRINRAGKVFYLVKWKNHIETTIEPRSSLLKGATQKLKKEINKIDKKG